MTILVSNGQHFTPCACARWVIVLQGLKNASFIQITARKDAWPQLAMPVGASKRILMLHSIVFRCIPDAFRKILVSKTQDKFGVIFNGSWLLKNVSGLPRYQSKIIKHKDISEWDASLLCKILLHTELHLLTEQIPSSDYIILSPSVLEITNESTAWKVCAMDKNFQMIIVQKRFGSTEVVPVKYTILFTNMGAVHLKLSNGLLRGVARGGGSGGSSTPLCHLP